MHRKRWSQVRLVAIVSALALGISGVSASAGTLLHLKAGQVKTAAVASRMGLTQKAGKGFYVVQFKQAIRMEDRKNLASLGARIVRYIPDDALVIKATSAEAATIGRSSASIEAIVPFQAAWKTAQEFSPSSVFSRSNREVILVALFPGENEAAAVRAIQALPGAHVLSSSQRSIVAEVTRPQVDEVAAIEAVEWVQPAPRIQSMEVKGLVNDDATGEAGEANGDYSDLTGFESGFRLINVDAAYGRGLSGKGQTIAMADTGLDRGEIATLHQDFAGRVPVGFAFGLYAKNWADGMGHGTHVAGSVTSTGAASGGRVRGGSYEAMFIPEGMWSPMMENLTVPSKISDLFSKAYEQGARIHTNSWGSPRNLGAYDGMASQTDEFIANNPDMLILFAAGNSGIDRDKDGRVDGNSIGSPATAKNVLTVGASKNYVLNGGLQVKLSQTRLKDNWPTEPLASSRMSENAQGMAAFSSRGPTSDGRLKPDVVAPGTNVLSNRSQDPKAEKLWGAYNKDYVWSGGTSMSTPVTAGAAGLVRQYLVDKRGIQPSAAMLKAVLMHTAFDLYPGQFGEVGKDKGQELIQHRPNTDEGYGRVDLDKATTLESAILVDEKKGLATGDQHSYPLKVTGNAKLTATLVYSDAAASASAAKSLVNDLDLILVDGTGKETVLNDHLNNTEMIEMDVPAGAYEIRVKGNNVPNGPTSGRQPYALIMSLN